MGRSRDITGVRFGRLVAVEKMEKRAADGQEMWEFRCDCGNRTVKRKDNVVSGKTKDCGCVKQEVQRKRDQEYIGQRYNRLVMLSPQETRSASRGRMWLCKCDCGNYVTLPFQDIKHHTKSCGCLQAEGTRKDIRGLKFGRLTAIEPTEERDRGEVVWRFRCDCGNEILRAQSLVSRGGCKSCGCLGRENRQDFYHAYSKNYVLGTNLAALRAEESDDTEDSNTGVKGIWYDSVRDCYVAKLCFQGETFRQRCGTLEEAKFVRAEFKKMHTEFLEWWDSLAPDAQAEICKNFEDERDAQLADFHARIRYWKDQYPLLDPEDSR